MPTASISSMKTMHGPPHLRASRFAFRARKRTITASMPMNVCAKPEPGIDTNGALKLVAIAFREHRLAGAGRAVEEEAALALAAGLLEQLAGLPQRDDLAHLFLRFGLAAHVFEPHAPVGVAGLEAVDLRDALGQSSGRRCDDDEEEEH